MKKLDIFYFSGTHWDREWYQDFQSYRYRLVKLVDNLMSLIESDPDYKTFHFDGQTVVLEDYCEICPENKEKLKKLITEGKILIGPWYVMPDEFLVSGESLIRNLMKGHQVCKEWGVEPWKYGYICDIFGHIAQMPQIFNGFDIKYSCLGRGTSEGAPYYFRWKAPDGSETTNFTLDAGHGYGSFQYMYGSEEDKTINNPKIVANIKEYVDGEIERSNAPVIVLMDALDHREAAVNTTDYIKKIAELYPEANVHHIDLTEQGKLVDKYKDTLPVKEGELSETTKVPHSYLAQIVNTLSSHYPIKQRNDRCQNMLEKVVEPALALADFEDIKLNRSYVKRAYDYLIQNHPHDSICGCSIDQVHKDMVYRFDQVDEISDVIVGDYLDQSFDKGIVPEDKFYNNILTLQNYLPYDVDKTVTVDLHFRPDYGTSYNEIGYKEAINAFRIYDAEGSEIPYQVISVQRGLTKHPYNFAAVIKYDLHKVTFRAKIPALSKAEYKIVPSNDHTRYLKKLTSGANYMENDLIRADIQPNGSIKITDKKTGNVYENLGYLVDDGELGDGWFHINPINDVVTSTLGGACTIAKVENGPERCVFKVTRTLSVPKELVVAPGEKRRSEETVELKFVSYVGLSSENRFVDVKMSFDNTAKDHRIRLMVPTGATTDKYFAGQAFYCVERKVGPDYEKQDWREIHNEYATNGIVGKRDKKGNGVAFVSPEGIHECCSFDDTEGTVGVTLFRGFYNTVFTNGETWCQHNHPMEFTYALAPVSKDVEYSDLLKIQETLAVKVPVCLAPVSDETEAKVHESAIKVSGKNVATSVVKCAETGVKGEIIVRVFNASSKKTKAEISFAKALKKAELVNLNEEFISDLSAEEKAVKFDLAPHKIATVKLYF